MQPTDEIAKLIHDIKLGKLEGSLAIAKHTVKMFMKLIEKHNWKTAEDLMKLIRDQGRIVVSALPQESVAANIIRRILKIIREAYDTILAEGGVKEKLDVPGSGDVNYQISDDAASLHKLVTQNSESDAVRVYTKHLERLREEVLAHLEQDAEQELDLGAADMYEKADEHIHSSELILTLGHSRSVESFLKSAAKTRKFEVVVAECAPECRGHSLAVNLAKSKIETTVITDSAIFAMMSRVNKVIIGTHSVLANGGLRAACGAYTVALAAKHFSVPVIVLVPIMYKLSPVYLCSYEQDAFNLVGCTEGVIPFNSSAARFSKGYSPIFDYVPPELVTLFISNTGGNAPSYVYRMLSELYHPEDYEL